MRLGIGSPRRRVRAVILATAAIAPLFAGCAAHAPHTAKAPAAAVHGQVAKDSASLYADLGGEAAVAALVDRFLGNVENDLRINLFFENTDLADLRRLVIEQFCEATGGPCKYSGRSMEEAHSGLNLGDADFAAFVEDLVAALDELNVPKSKQDRLLALLAPMKPQVVGQ